MKMKNFTIIPNEILEKNQLTVPAKLLLCILLRHCQDKEYCFPSQKRLGDCLHLDPRSVRKYIRELESHGLISTKRTGFSRPNTYKVAKQILSYEKGDSLHIGSEQPLCNGSFLPPKNTYRKKQYNKKISETRNELVEKLSMNKRNDSI